jgi:hypothetical protein
VEKDKFTGSRLSLPLAAIIVTAIFVAGVYLAVVTGVTGFVRYKTAAEGGITATGSASKNFLSDSAAWTGSFSADGETTQEAYGYLQAQADTVEKYLSENGVAAEDFTFSSVDITAKTKPEYTDSGDYIGERFDGYRLEQRVMVSSDDVDKIQAISMDSTRLIDSGVDFRSEQPKYYYTKLDELKLQMIEEATQNAKQRVDIVAKNSGSSVGKLMNATLGVFQITALNSASDEFSASGSLNTSSKWKTVSVTVRLYYAVR